MCGKASQPWKQQSSNFNYGLTMAGLNHLGRSCAVSCLRRVCLYLCRCNCIHLAIILIYSTGKAVQANQWNNSTRCMTWTWRPSGVVPSWGQCGPPVEQAEEDRWHHNSQQTWPNTTKRLPNDIIVAHVGVNCIPGRLERCRTDHMQHCPGNWFFVGFGFSSLGHFFYIL